jgi:5-methylcytosine-specific restriction protein A
VPLGPSHLRTPGDREPHHVIALADDGEDRVTNVIALCPNDHRKARFSADRDSIEQEMLSKLMTQQSVRGP